MPTADVILPVPGAPLSVRLSYLDRGGSSDIGYLQRVRSMANVSGPILQGLEQRYKAGLAIWPFKLAAHVGSPVSAIVAPPSSRPELVAPYLGAVSNRFPGAIDLSGRFHRTGALRSGEGATLEALIAATTYQAAGDEGQFQSIVIVDDVVADGKTAATVIALLRAAGVPETATWHMAAPLWLG